MTNMEKLDQFVREITKDRDPTHGYAHMSNVATVALNIAKAEGVRDDLMDYIAIVGMIHDVDDHKYDHDGKLSETLREFLKQLWPVRYMWFMDIAHRISYSKEVKNGTDDWLGVIGSDGIIVRNMVSDADKLDAIDKVGIMRCIIFNSKHRSADQGPVTVDELVKIINEHADEKLLLIKDKFIRTKTGRSFAKPLHEEMLDILGMLPKFVETALKNI